jgi:hypothetical protein
MDQTAHCPKHPESAATGVCSRCGAFFCSADRRVVDGVEYCEACAALPEIDYLEAFRLKHWGKRDAWAWIIGFAGLIQLLAGASQLSSAIERGNSQGVAMGLALLAASLVSFCFMARMRWARVGLLVVPVILALASEVPDAFLGMLVPLFMALAIFIDTRNKLFFRIDVPRVSLRKTWDLYANNTIARTGLAFGIFGLIVFPIAPIGLLLSIIGLRRVDPKARPPVGHKGQAIVGIVLGSLGCAVGILWALMLARRA